MWWLLMLACQQECGGKAEQYVSYAVWCDGIVDCWGGQDERDETCPTELFYCDQPEPQAILQEQVCDGFDDCGDGFDELDCDD